MLAPWFTVAELLTTKETRPWDYLINLSGDAFPVTAFYSLTGLICGLWLLLMCVSIAGLCGDWSCTLASRTFSWA
jgi:hypothetical protein